MPTYEFRLPDGTIIEKVFKISEVPEEIPNPNGEGTAVRIISGGAALVFKGSGFYLTDYGRNAHRTQGDAPKPSESATTASDASASKTKSESAGSSSSESKPAAATAPAPAPKSDPKPTSGSGPAAS